MWKYASFRSVVTDQSLDLIWATFLRLLTSWTCWDDADPKSYTNPIIPLLSREEELFLWPLSPKETVLPIPTPEPDWCSSVWSVLLWNKEDEFKIGPYNIVPQFAEPNEPHLVEAAMLPNGLKGVSASQDWPLVQEEQYIWSPETAHWQRMVKRTPPIPSLEDAGIPILQCSQTDIW